jgi:hypothetical protein
LARLEARALAGASAEELAAALREIEAWTAGGNDRLLLAYLCVTRAGKAAESQALFARLVDAARTDPWLNRPLLVNFLLQFKEVSNPHAARSLLALLAPRPFAAHLVDQLREETIQELLPLTVIDGEPDPACLDILASFEPWPVWTEEMLSLRASAYARRSHPLAARAAANLARFREDRGRTVEGLLPASGGE